MQKRAITDLNAPNGSRDIQSQSQEFEQENLQNGLNNRPFVFQKQTIVLILVAIATKFDIK